MSDFVADAEWQKHLLTGKPFLDVRAPIEFASGAVANAANLPLLTDSERHEVGICYKKQGPEAAVALGHHLVHGSVKEQRVLQWSEWVRHNPEGILYCFRGGQRSAITQKWLHESGSDIPRVAGGYKVIRQFLLAELAAVSDSAEFTTLGGHTGSGKTALLRQWLSAENGKCIVDLEALANHRGSAFGKELSPQPSQADFENRLAPALVNATGFASSIWVEDEARTIGRITLPDSLFVKMRTGPLVLISEPRAIRAELTCREYVHDAFKALRKIHSVEQSFQELRLLLTTPIKNISRKLGGDRAQKALGLINSAMDKSERHDQWDDHLLWIDFLLEVYYDPYYEAHRERIAHRVKFTGSRHEVSQWFAQSVSN